MDLLKFTKEILNGKFHFLFSVKFFNGKAHVLCSVKLSCLGKPKRNMYGPNMKGLTKEYLNQIEISLSLFEYWSCGLTRTKLLKVI